MRLLSYHLAKFSYAEEKGNVDIRGEETVLGMGRTEVLGEKAEQDGPCGGRLGLLGGSMRAPVLASWE